MIQTITKQEMQTKFPNRKLGKKVIVSIVEKLIPHFYLEIKGYVLTPQDNYVEVTHRCERTDKISDEEWGIEKHKTWESYYKNCEEVNHSFKPTNNYKERKIKKLIEQINKIELNNGYYNSSQREKDVVEWLQYTLSKWENAEWKDNHWIIEPMSFLNFKQWQANCVLND